MKRHPILRKAKRKSWRSHIGGPRQRQFADNSPDTSMTWPKVFWGAIWEDASARFFQPTTPPDSRYHVL